jgi:hypothetical protein
MKKLLMAILLAITVSNAEVVELSTEQIVVGGKTIIVRTICKNDYVYSLYTDGDSLVVIQEFEKTSKPNKATTLPIKCGAPE